MSGLVLPMLVGSAMGAGIVMATTAVLELCERKGLVSSRRRGRTATFVDLDLVVGATVTMIGVWLVIKFEAIRMLDNYIGYTPGNGNDETDQASPDFDDYYGDPTPFYTERIVLSDPVDQALHDIAVLADMLTAGPFPSGEVGYVVNNFHERMGINSYGGSDIFPHELHKLGYVGLTPQNVTHPGADDHRVVLGGPPLGTVGLPARGFLDWGLMVLQPIGVLLAVVLATLVLTSLCQASRMGHAWGMSHAWVVSHSAPAGPRWGKVRRDGGASTIRPRVATAAITVFVLVLSQLSPTFSGWFWPLSGPADVDPPERSTWLKTLGGEALTTPLRFVIILHSAQFDQLGLFKDWQIELGPGCAVVNHQPSEWGGFDKASLMRQVKDWSAEEGCDHRQVIPATFFLNSVQDCVELFTSHHGLAAESDGIWFQKDPANDGFGQGVTVHTMAMLRAKWGVNASAPAAERCAAISGESWIQESDVFVQLGVQPLLLAGQRKFDIRLYVLITDREPYAAYLHWAYLRFADGSTKPQNETVGADGELDRSQYIANINVKKPKHRLEDHWFPQHKFQDLLSSDEARPILDNLGLKDGAEAYAHVNRNIYGAVAQMARAMAKKSGKHRGGYVLCGVDVLIDTKLRAVTLETNVDPEFGIDRIRDPIGRATATNMFRLLAEQHGKTVHLFDGSPEATWGRGKCFSTKYAAVSRSSPAGHKLLNAETPGWTLLYSETVEPPYSIVSTFPGYGEDSICYAAPVPNDVAAAAAAAAVTAGSKGG